MMVSKYTIRLEEVPQYVPPAHGGVVNKLLIDERAIPANNFLLWLVEIGKGGDAEPHYHESEQGFFI